MILRVFDPTNERKPAGGKPAPRPASLAGKTIGFISNGKEGTAGYFAHLDRMLRQEFGVADIVLRRKSNYSAPADGNIVAEIKNWKARGTGSAPRNRGEEGRLRQRRRDDGQRARHADLQVRRHRPPDQECVGRAA